MGRQGGNGFALCGRGRLTSIRAQIMTDNTQVPPEPQSLPEAPIPHRRASDLPSDSPWWARWLEANIAEAWKWASMRWGAACVVLAEIYAQYPKESTEFIQGFVPASWWPHLIAGGFLVQMLFRLVNLKKPKNDGPN